MLKLAVQCHCAPDMKQKWVNKLTTGLDQKPLAAKSVNSIPERSETTDSEQIHKPFKQTFVCEVTPNSCPGKASSHRSQQKWSFTPMHDKQQRASLCAASTQRERLTNPKNHTKKLSPSKTAPTEHEAIQRDYTGHRPIGVARSYKAPRLIGLPVL